MPETPKEHGQNEKDQSEKPDRNTESWEADQKQREYYYDDAHGYEVYENDETENDQMESLK